MTDEIAAQLRPKLRDIVRVEVEREGVAQLVLIDPMQLAEPFAIDAEFGAVLDLLRGQRTISQIRQTLLMRPGAPAVETDDLVAFCNELSESGWLDDDRFRAAWAETHAGFLDAERRPPIMGGILYPSEPAEIEATLRQQLGAAEDLPVVADVVALITPHQPIERLGPLAGGLRLPPRDALDAIVLLGTDHQRGLLPVALTRKGFATPLGVVPCSPLADELADALPWIEREEIRHRHAHSLELPSLLLAWIYGADAPPIIPLLVGSHPGDESEKMDAVLAALERLSSGHRLVIWASAELGHAGPGFGTPQAGPNDLERADSALVAALSTGRALAVERAARDAARQRASGAATLEAMARLLPLDAECRELKYGTVAIGDDAEPRGWTGAVAAHYVAPS
jgi:AmmeMemoRadiSam system protein B